MNKILTIAAGSSLGARSYESPALAIVEVHSEGVLCMSTRDNLHETWGEEDLW